MTGKEILELPMKPNDSGETTVRGYLRALVKTVVAEGEGFSGKRPFGNSGWIYDLYQPLVTASLVTGELDEDGFLDHIDDKAKAKALIQSAIEAL